MNHRIAKKITKYSYFKDWFGEGPTYSHQQITRARIQVVRRERKAEKEEYKC